MATIAGVYSKDRDHVGKLASIPSNTQPLLVVGAGDSFTSGAGIGDYLSETNIPNVNECERSKHSIANQVATMIGGRAVNIACARTTIDGMYRSNWNEPSQVDQIDPDTDVIVLTIGGNQVKFGSFLETCFEASCDPSTEIYQKAQAALQNPTFTSKLIDLYGDILREAPHAKVYVDGYEKIADAHSICTVFGRDDDAAISTLTDLINQIIQAAVTSVDDPRLTYVSPVNGDMCEHGVSRVTIPDVRRMLFGDGDEGFPGHPTAAANLILADKIALSLYPPKP